VSGSGTGGGGLADDPEQGAALLDSAIVGGYVDVARELIDAGADVEGEVGLGTERTLPLLRAAGVGNQGMVRTLVSRGADCGRAMRRAMGGRGGENGDGEGE